MKLGGSRNQDKNLGMELKEVLRAGIQIRSLGLKKRLKGEDWNGKLT